jgi:hypothetical protein
MDQRHAESPVPAGAGQLMPDAKPDPVPTFRHDELVIRRRCEVPSIGNDILRRIRRHRAQRLCAAPRFRVSVVMIKLAGVLGAVTLAVCGCSAADSSAAGRAAQEFVTAVTGSGGAPACALPAPRARDGLGPAGCGPGSPVG